MSQVSRRDLVEGSSLDNIRGPRRSTESSDVSHHEPVAEPQPARAAVEDPKPVASTTQTVAPISKEKVSSSERRGNKQTVSNSKERHEQPTVARQPRHLLSTLAVFSSARRPPVPAWWLTAKSVVSRRSTFASSPSERIRLRSRTQGHETRQRRVTLSERRPARSIEFELRPTSVPAHATAAANSPGSLQVALASVRGTGLRRRQFDWNDAVAAFECRSGFEASESRVVGLQDLDDIGSDRAECTVSSVGKSGAVRPNDILLSHHRAL